MRQGKYVHPKDLTLALSFALGVNPPASFYVWHDASGKKHHVQVNF